MTTSLTRLMSAISESVIPKSWLGYFRESFRGEINDELTQLLEASGQTKADLARKIDRRPEQITRWLSAPCNLEIDTISDLALAFGLVPKIRFEKIREHKSNVHTHDFIAFCEGVHSATNLPSQAIILNLPSYSSVTMKTMDTHRRILASRPRHSAWTADDMAVIGDRFNA